MISHHLIVVGDPISERDLIIYALADLNNLCYNPFVRSIIMMIVKPNFNAIHSQLETYKRTILQQSGLDKDNMFHALMASTNCSFSSHKSRKN